jgi:hypothetical protein
VGRLLRRGAAVAVLLSAAASWATELEQAHRRLGRVIGSFETLKRQCAPERFAPATLESVTVRLSAVRTETAAGMRPRKELALLERALPALERDLEDLRRECGSAAAAPVDALRRRVEAAHRRAADGLARQILPSTPEAVALVEEARAALAAPPRAYAEDPKGYDEQIEALRGLANRLENLARDPCAGPYGDAIRAREFGQASRARELFEELARRECLDPGIPLEARAELRKAAPAPAAPAAPPPPPPAVAEARAPEAPSTAPAAERPAPALPAPGTARPPAAANGFETLALDVWQSAWGDFTGFGDLPDRLRKAGITAVNLNPGLAISPGTWPRALSSLAPLVSTLRKGGVRRVNFLYAELGLPIAGYAQFVRAHPDLGMDTIVDDSEFTDDHRDRFAENLAAVRAAGLRYAAFVTVEGYGNSGVSDAARSWAIANLDQTILMSYFGCSVEDQAAQLEPWLRQADGHGRKGSVQVAILLGSKSVGRERSCERQLDGAALRQFLRDLDKWARRHPSYGGIVLETNERFPARLAEAR